MDEFHFRRKLRRVALLAAINCTLVTSSAFHLMADEGHLGASQQELRSLLQEGWQQQSVDRVEVPVPAETSKLRKLTPFETTAAKPMSLFSVSDDPNKPQAPKQLPTVTPSRDIGSRKSTPRLTAPNGYTLPPSKTTRLTTPKPTPRVPVVQKNVLPKTAPNVYGDSIEDLKREALRTIARDNGFGLVAPIVDGPEKQLTPNATTNNVPLPKQKSVLVHPEERVQVARPTKFMATLHTNKLREITQKQLDDARDRLRRGATYSAKQLATKALQNIVTMRDLQEGGNRHASELQDAFIAIRESSDFDSKFGPVDQPMLKRLVDVHKTSALKNRDLTSVAPLQAMDLYLTAAHDRLVAATGTVRAASDALVLLSRIEQIENTDGASHSEAVTVMLQSAAVTSDPNNAAAQYALGNNLLKQGMIPQAAKALQRGVQLSPSRQGYQRLMMAANRMKDDVTAQQCQVALRSRRLKSNSPVRQLTTRDFASTYKPSVQELARTEVERKTVSSVEVKMKPKIEAKPVSTAKRIFRSWVTPKFR